MLKAFILGALMTTGLTLTGCASKAKQDRVEAGTDEINVQKPVEASSTDHDEDTSGLASAQRLVYFGFDSTVVDSDGQAVIDWFAKHLIARPHARVRLEGHADERGTRAYNVGLGERRANAVKQTLIGGGAAADQISVASYGEERPANPGNSEEAWAKNRRVEFVLL